MELRQEITSGAAKFFLKGKFTFSDHELFREIINLIKDGAVSSIVMDFEEVNFIDSAGLGMILIAKEESDKKNCSVILKGAKGQIEKMFKVSKFDTLFTIK